MKKIVEEKMKKENDAPLHEEPRLPKNGETMEDFIERLAREDEAQKKEDKARITSGDDLLDKAFNIALKKKFDKK